MDDQWYQRLFEQSPDPALIIEDRHFIDCNNAAVRFLGYRTKADLLCCHPSDLSPPFQPDGQPSFEKAERILAQVFEQGFRRFDWVHTKADGSSFTAEVSLAAIEHHGRTAIYCTWRDITERIEAEEQLAAAKLEVEKASEAKSRFFASASHDLRQPFQAMRLFFDVLDAATTNPDQRRALEALDKSMRSAEVLLTDLLDVARLETARPPAIQRLAPSAIIQEVVEELRPLAVEKGLAIRTVLRGDLSITADGAMLKRILGNLVGNAIRYTERGGVLVGLRRRADHVIIEVWDTGIGIDHQAQALVFEEFYQVNNPSRDRSRGVGLGLSIVTRLCHQLGFGKSVVSRPGRGSVFRIAAPLDRPHP